MTFFLEIGNILNVFSVIRLYLFFIYQQTNDFSRLLNIQRYKQNGENKEYCRANKQVKKKQPKHAFWSFYVLGWKYHQQQPAVIVLTFHFP
jgi:hypothetical protein